MKYYLMRIWQYIPMLIILIISIATYIGVQNYLQNNNQIIISTNSHEPLYTMTNATWSNIESINKVAYTIQAKKAVQYEDDKSFFLDDINILGSQVKPNNIQQNSTMQAISATLDKDITQVDFNGSNIKFNEIKNNQNNSFVINSDKITFYPKLDQIETKAKTNIQHTTNLGNVNTLQANSMVFNNTDKTFKLVGQTSGQLTSK